METLDAKKFFILYKPKDIVSGDFYYAISHQHPNSAVEKFYLCTADCTGHGVPGAFMSMLNISYLNESIIEKQIASPNLVLDHIREEIIASLNPEGSEEESKDGMDCILAAFDFTNNVLEYAAANNSFYIVRNGELISCPADKMPVGKHSDMKPFTLRKMDLQKGFPTVQKPNEDVIEALTTCCICGSQLVFQHQTDFLAHKVTEKGCCTQCGIRTKENEFILQ